ncbi:hypothetical protein Vafri_4156, partial [Volvox africanus]
TVTRATAPSVITAAATASIASGGGVNASGSALAASVGAAAGAVGSLTTATATVTNRGDDGKSATATIQVTVEPLSRATSVEAVPTVSVGQTVVASGADLPPLPPLPDGHAHAASPSPADTTTAPTNDRRRPSVVCTGSLTSSTLTASATVPAAAAADHAVLQ